MPEINVKLPNGKTKTFVTEEGLTFPKELVERQIPAGNLKLQLQWVKEMEIKDEDIVICAYPKAGTHWLWEVLVMLKKQKAEYEVKIKETQMLEFCKKEDISELPPPRVLNTHVLPSHLPQGVLDKKTKIIHVMRNPKDIQVSLYYHFLAMSFLPGKNMEFDAFLQTAMGDQRLVTPCSYFTYIKEYEAFRKANPDQLLNVFFEDMKKQPEIEIKRIAEFIGQKPDAEFIKDIASKCDFSAMKKANDEVKDDFTRKECKDGKPCMYRKGVIGDWKNHFTVAENEAFDKLMERELNGTDIRFQYE